MERSDSNDILCTYFRPRRAAELIQQNQVLNLWKDYKKNGQSLGSWMTPTMPNHIKSPSVWPQIPNSAAMNSVRNGNISSRSNFDELKNKPFYGIRPTLNVKFELDSNSLATNNNLNKKFNHSHYSNEAGSTLQLQRNPIMPTPFLRDNFG